MNILGIDYGEKNIGLAWVDDGLGVVLPFHLVRHDEDLFRELKEKIEEQRIDEVVVGLPIAMSGERNTPNVKKVQAFIDELKQHIDIPIHTIDERMTSQYADRLMGGDASRDEKAAMVILETYLEQKL